MRGTYDLFASEPLVFSFRCLLWGTRPRDRNADSRPPVSSTSASLSEYILENNFPEILSNSKKSGNNCCVHIRGLAERALKHTRNHELESNICIGISIGYIFLSFFLFLAALPWPWLDLISQRSSFRDVTAQSSCVTRAEVLGSNWENDRRTRHACDLEGRRKQGHDVRQAQVTCDVPEASLNTPVITQIAHVAFRSYKQKATFL